MKQYHYNHYNAKLKSYSRNLRNESTKAEIKIWCEILRAKKMKGYPFLRQRSIGKYIADFFCKELQLIIEIDGITHHHEDVYEKDIIKEEFLKSLGYSILRFTDNEVMNNISMVYECLQEFIDTFETERINSTHPPAPP